MMAFRQLIPALLIIVAASSALATDPIPVSAGRLGELLVDKKLRAPASVVPANKAVITAQVTALIERVHKDVGDQVDKGELLIGLDNDNANLALAQANAALEAVEAQIVEARARLQNAEELLARNFVSDEEMISRQAAVAVLVANLAGQKVAVNIAQLDFARTRIKAPYAAVVVDRQAQVGSYAQPGTPLITLIQTDDREVDVEIDPRHAPQLANVGNFRFVSQGNEWPVTLARVSSVIESSARIVRARFVFNGESARIGASGQLVWKQLSGVLPIKLIVQRGNQFGIFIAESNTARFVSIPGAQQGRPAAVALPADTEVIVRGHTRLQDGDAISITPQ